MVRGTTNDLEETDWRKVVVNSVLLVVNRRTDCAVAVRDQMFFDLLHLCNSYFETNDRPYLKYHQWDEKVVDNSNLESDPYSLDQSDP